MDFSCDRCGRRYFVPDELVQGRAFRAKCDDCNHAFVVSVPDTAGAATPKGAGEHEPAGQALSDADLAEISNGLGPFVPEWPELDEAPLPGPNSWPEHPEAAPLSLPPLPSWSELPAAAPPRAAPIPAPTSRTTPPAAAPPRAAPVPAPTSRTKAPAAPRATAPFPSSPSRAERPRAPAPVAKARLEGELAPARARRGAPEPEADAGALTEEEIIAAGARQRLRRGIAAGVVLLGACALGALLFSRTGGSGAKAARATATSSRAAPSAGGAVPFDASALAFRAKSEPARAGGTKAAPTRKRRRTVRLEDRKLFDLLGRKDDVAMEAPRDDVELDSAKDALDPAAVERTVAKSRRAFDACVTKALRLNPGLRVSKRATLMVTVEPNGRVTGGWIAEEQIEGTELGRCLVTVSSRMSFPSFEGEAIDVSIPLSLSAIQ